MAQSYLYSASLLAALAATSAVFAQPTKAPAKSTPPAAAPTTALTNAAPVPKGNQLIEFSDKPVHLDSAGVSMKVPVGCHTTSNTAVDASSIQIIPEDSTWLLQIESPRSTRTDMSLKEVCDAMIEQLLLRSARLTDAEVKKDDKGIEFGKTISVDHNGETAPAVRGQILERNDDLKITGWPAAARFYVETYPGDVTGAVNRAIVRGFTIVKVSSDRFVTFELKTPKNNLPDVKSIYETTVATSAFADPVNVLTGRKAAIEGGLKIIEGIDPATLQKLVEGVPERWQRLYIPSKTGARPDDTELGYRRISYAWDKRGKLDQTRAEAQYTASERQLGAIIKMDARVLDIDLLNPGKKVRRVIDSASAYFISPDRLQEGWNIRNAFRDGKTTTQITEIGARNASDMVVSVTANGESQQVRPIIQGDFAASGYVSQAESRLLHQLIMMKKLPIEFGFYVWNSTAQAIKLRRDVLEESKDSPGAWKITSRATEDSKPEIATYNERGDLIRIELLNDVGETMYWEPIDFQTLLNLWKEKGLPLE